MSSTFIRAFKRGGSSRDNQNASWWLHASGKGNGPSHEHTFMSRLSFRPIVSYWAEFPSAKWMLQEEIAVLLLRILTSKRQGYPAGDDKINLSARSLQALLLVGYMRKIRIHWDFTQFLHPAPAAPIGRMHFQSCYQQNNNCSFPPLIHTNESPQTLIAHRLITFLFSTDSTTLSARGALCIMYASSTCMFLFVGQRSDSSMATTWSDENDRCRHPRRMMSWKRAQIACHHGIFCLLRHQS